MAEYVTLAAFSQVAQALIANKVRFMVVGGLALILFTSRPAPSAGVNTPMSE